MKNRPNTKVAVIGCGASGMSAASHLARQGLDVHVFEKASDIGGRMSTQMLNGKRVCLGGKNIGQKYAVFREFCKYFEEDNFENFGLNSSNSAETKVNTFDGDKKIKSILNFAKGLPVKDILRLLPLLLAIKKDRNNAYFSGSYFRKYTSNKDKERTLDSYFSEKLQARLVRPLVVRTNGAEPNEVPMANFGTNLSMIMDSYEQLQEGPEKLFEKFKKTVTVHLNFSVAGLIVNGKSIDGIISEGGERLEFDHIVLATPAYVSAKILESVDPGISKLLSAVRYFPVGILVAEYEKAVFSMAKRAWTFPQHSVLSNAGSYGINDRNIVRYTFSGQHARSLLNQKPAIHELLKIAEQEVGEHTKLSLGKCKGCVGEIMTHGLCAYSHQHHSLIANVFKRLNQFSGMHLAGDYIEGVSIEACFRSGLKASDAIKNKIGKEATVYSEA